MSTPAAVMTASGTDTASSLDGVTMIAGTRVPSVDGNTEQKTEVPASNTIDWDGDDDPQNPRNWPESKKWFNIGVLSVLSLIT